MSLNNENEMEFVYSCNEVRQCVTKLREEKNKSLEKYKKIQADVSRVDVSSDRDFQTLFDGFYRVRRSEKWRNDYFALFEKAKGIKDISFQEIFDEVCNINQHIEVSFSSKMLATLNPKKPIWDRNVLSIVGIKQPSTGKKDRKTEALKKYEELCGWYDRFLKTDEAKKWIRIWDKELPDYKHFSRQKKIDFILWRMYDIKRESKE